MRLLQTENFGFDWPDKKNDRTEPVTDLLDMVSPKTVKEVQRLTRRAATLNMFVLKATEKCLSFFKVLKPVSRRRISVFIFSCVTNSH